MTAIVLPGVDFKLEYAFLEMLFHSTVLSSFVEEANLNGFIFRILKSEQDFLVSDRDRMRKKRIALN